MTENKQLEYYHHNHKKKFSLVTLGILSFVLILIILLFSAFSGSSGRITGKNVVIDGIKINSQLNIIPLELESIFDRIEIQGTYNDYISVGGEKFDLSKSSNLIIIEDFDGEILIDGKNINLLKGHANKISINGVPVMPESTSLLSIKTENFKFKSFEIDSGVYIHEASFNATGILNMGQTTLNLDDDVLNLNRFYGSMIIDENFMKLNGEIEGINTEGETKISIS